MGSETNTQITLSDDNAKDELKKVKANIKRMKKWAKASNRERAALRKKRERWQTVSGSIAHRGENLLKSHMDHAIRAFANVYKALKEQGGDNKLNTTLLPDLLRKANWNKNGS